MNAPLIQVREVGLRDGLQMVDRFVPTETKLAWLAAESAAGVRAFEITSFVSKSRMPQFADAEVMTAACRDRSESDASVLTLNTRGAERALEAGASRLVYVLSASGAHSRGNAGRDTEAALQEFTSVARLVHAFDAGNRPRIEAGIATAFGCTMEGAIDPEHVRRLATRLAELGADEIMLADTVGYAEPRHVARLFAQVGADLGSIPLGGHFHDTRGLGLANVVAALDAGVTKFDSSLGGLGGCPFAPGASGNVSTEDLAYLLQAMGYRTGIDLQALLSVRRALTDWLPGVALYGSLAQAGLPRHFATQESQAEVA